MHVPDVPALLLAAVALAFVLWVLGSAGRSLVRMALWGAFGLAVYVLMSVLRAPPALSVAVNPITVGAAALLGLPGIGLAVLAHALFRA